MTAGLRFARAVVAIGAMASAAALLPVTVAASTGSATLTLSPAHGPAGTRFTATFTFSATPCDEYSVGFWWDSANPQLLGATYASDYGEGCRASVDTTAPQDDATPGTSYAVGAYSSPGAVSFGGGPGPRGDAAFTVTPEAGAPAPPSPAATPPPGSHAGGAMPAVTAQPAPTSNAIVIERRGPPPSQSRPASPQAGEPLIASAASGDAAPIGAMALSLVLVAGAMAVRVRMVGARRWPRRRPRPSPGDAPPG